MKGFRPIVALGLLQWAGIVHAWEGKVFVVNGKKVTVSSTDTGSLKPGRQLYILHNKTVLGHGRVDAFFHTRVEMTLRSGEARKGLRVTDQRPRQEAPGRTVNILRDPRSGYEVAFPSDWKTHQPQPDNPALQMLLSPDEKTSIVINPFAQFGGNKAADYLKQYADRSGLGEPIRFGEINEEAQSNGAEAAHEGIYLWQGKPTVVLVYTKGDRAYLVQFRNYIRTHPQFSQRNEDDAFRILDSFRIGKIKTQKESVGEGKITPQ